MKKFLMYCVVLIGVLFIGFTTYYFVNSKEVIALAFPESTTIRMNVRDTLELKSVISQKEAEPNTTFKVEISNNNVLSFNEDNKIFTADSVGDTTVTIKPSNLKYGPFIFNVKVGNGKTAENPFYISTVAQLKDIGNIIDWTTSASYELVNDLDLSNIDNWTPIAPTGFTGKFNGGGYTIYNLTMTATNVSQKAGLFASVGANGNVYNLKMARANIVGSYASAGVIAGENNGTISNCDVSSNSVIKNTAVDGFTGGIVGKNICSITGTRASIGICGVSDLTLEIGASAGGIAGYNEASTIENCYAVVSNVTSTQINAFYGGIVGTNTSNKLGGVVKYAVVQKTHAILTTTNISSTGLIGGIAGKSLNQSTTVKNYYYRNYYVITDVSGAIAKEDTTVTTEKTLEEQFASKSMSDMKNQSTYVEWDFENIWILTGNYATLNYLKIYQAGKVIDVKDDPNKEEVDDGEDDKTDALKAMIDEMRANPSSGKTYVVTKTYDIDVSTAVWGGGNWIPIGNDVNPFTCRFAVGDGVTLTFRNITITNYKYAGFFGYLGSGAVVEGITFQNIKITTPNSTSSVAYNGAIAGYTASGSSIFGCKVKGIEIKGQGYIGGAVGSNYGSISNVEISDISTSNNKLETSSGSACMGGIAGNNNGVVTASAVREIKLTTTSANASNIGGIVGVNLGEITGSGATNMDLTSTSTAMVKAGGIAGTNENSISETYANAVNITLSTSNSNTFAGGLTALNAVNGKISKSLWANGTIVAYTSAGLAAENCGKLSACASGSENTGYGLGEIQGVYVGGMIGTNYSTGDCENCFGGSVLKGVSSSGFVAGMSVFINKDSMIKYCFSSATFSPNSVGVAYSDTRTEYRNFWTRGKELLFGQTMGSIENSLLIYRANTTLQGVGVLVDEIDNPLFSKYDIVISEEKANGSVDNYARFTEKGFSSSVWNFSFSTTHYPTVCFNNN